MSFVVTRQVKASPAHTWETMTHWPSHGRWIPLTKVWPVSVAGAGAAPGEGVGGRFLARTGLGPIGFDDPMEITEWQVPGPDGVGRCAVLKHGRVVLGTAVFELTGDGSGGSRVTWTEDVELVPVRLTRPFGRLVALVGRVGLAGALARMAAEAEAGPQDVPR